MLASHSGPQAESQVMSCEFCGGQNGIGTDFSQIFSSFPLLIIIQALLDIHLSLPHLLCENPDQTAYCGKWTHC
jgi:hypothetical protein